MENNLKRLLDTHGIKASKVVTKSGLSTATIDRIVNKRSGTVTAVTKVQVTNAMNALLSERVNGNGMITVLITDIFPDDLPPTIA